MNLKAKWREKFKTQTKLKNFLKQNRKYMADYYKSPEVKEQYKTYYLRNKEKIRQRYLQNREKNIQYAKQYQQRNKEQIREYWRLRSLKKNLTPSQLLRYSIENQLWKEAVLKRDRLTCQNCKAKNCKLFVHHIKRWRDYPDLRFAINNGITLWQPCHVKADHQVRAECAPLTDAKM